MKRQVLRLPAGVLAFVETTLHVRRHSGLAAIRSAGKRVYVDGELTRWAAECTGRPRTLDEEPPDTVWRDTKILKLNVKTKADYVHVWREPPIGEDTAVQFIFVT